MRIAALVKQIPKFEEMELGPDGRLRRDGIELEMNPYCRRAVAQAVELAATLDGDHSVTVLTLGPPAAEDMLREAIAWGIERDVDSDGVLVTDPAFAGSDTLATARALAAALEHDGPFDLVLAGRNSVDADTGQVGPELAELLDLPFLTGVRHLNVDRRRTSSTPAASTTTAGCRPRLASRRCCRPPNGSSIRARSTRPARRGARRPAPHGHRRRSRRRARGARPAAPPRSAQSACTR